MFKSWVVQTLSPPLLLTFSSHLYSQVTLPVLKVPSRFLAPTFTKFLTPITLLLRLPPLATTLFQPPRSVASSTFVRFFFLQPPLFFLQLPNQPLFPPVSPDLTNLYHFLSLFFFLQTIPTHIIPYLLHHFLLSALTINFCPPRTPPFYTATRKTQLRSIQLCASNESA